MGNERILVIDDSPEIVNLFSEYLRGEGYEVDTAQDGAKGIAFIEGNFYDLILTDLKMPGTDGMDVLRYITEHSPDSICIILTGYGTVRNAVEAIKLGAFDYLTKPVKLDEILVTFQRAFEYRDLKRENIHLRSQLKKKYRF
jgi:DNA-binding NtrC family response regulator